MALVALTAAEQAEEHLVGATMGSGWVGRQGPEGKAADGGRGPEKAGRYNMCNIDMRDQTYHLGSTQTCTQGGGHIAPRRAPDSGRDSMRMRIAWGNGASTAGRPSLTSTALQLANEVGRAGPHGGPQAGLPQVTFGCRRIVQPGPGTKAIGSRPCIWPHLVVDAGVAGLGRGFNRATQGPKLDGSMARAGWFVFFSCL